jgi:hypothetical protein
MDAWIEWEGGECPVPPNRVVDVKIRSGEIFYGPAFSYAWTHGGNGRRDIVAYKLKDSRPAPEPVASALGVQEGGSHYKDMKIQPIEFIHANSLDFFQGNIVKYAARHKAKNGAQDLRKVIHYAQLALELQYGEKA